ncbi:MAG: AAA family ATPase [Bacteroidetes bacterium]|nr:AAA family ATPase [Bacteroidota bacterium]MBL0017348.1 AAA family ATPase [Bacteroidota bacterium]MBP8073603.1 AAA family ATPase [Bacteroidia bacterium]
MKSTEMEDLRIRRLVLDKVGVFEHLDLEFKESPAKDKAEIHIFVGENGTGKTTLLEAMTCFEGWYGRTTDKDGNILYNRQSNWRIEQKMAKSNSCFSIDFGGHTVGKTNDQKGETSFLNPLDDFFSKYFSGSLTKAENGSYLFFAYNASRFLKTAFAKPGRDFYDQRLLAEGISWDKESVNEALFQWVMDCDTKAAFAIRRNAKEEALKYEAELKKVNETISRILGRSVGFAIDEKNLGVRIKVQDEMTDAEGLALGYQSLIGWLADLIYRLSQFPDSLNSRFTLFLDEIDIHLHPKAQRRILPVIQQLFPKAQIFITTHSPFVIGSVDDAWVYKFKLDENGHSVFDGEPRRSEDAQSYRTILEEVFDIKEEFGIEAQTQLDEFYQLRQEVLKGSTDSTWLTFNKLGMKLASQSPEMHSYVSLELRQAARILNRQLIH